MIAHVMRPPVAPLFSRAPTTQEVAVVMCGGGEPFAEYELARELCAKADRNVTIFAGNDMIEHFSGDIAHAATLHPDKLQLWLPRRRAAGYNMPDKVWAHRPWSGITDWTRDWQGSTGLFCTKVARECGFVHVILCGVHMTVEGAHFVRKQQWNAAHGFRRGWTARMNHLRPYVRSFGGWTKEQLGAPTEEWLRETIVDQHVNLASQGQRA